MLQCVVCLLPHPLRRRSRSTRFVVGESQLPNQAVRSQLNLIIVIRQSSGKYDCHGWTTERGAGAANLRRQLFGEQAIVLAFDDRITFASALL